MCSSQILKESRKGRALGRPELDGSGPPAQGTCIAVLFFSIPFIKQVIFSPLYSLVSFVVDLPYKSGFVSGLSILFH